MEMAPYLYNSIDFIDFYSSCESNKQLGLYKNVITLCSSLYFLTAK